MKIKRFEDLECWQEARDLTRTVYAYTNRPEFSKDFRLSGQITGASISIMNNICEGFDSRSNKLEFRYKDQKKLIFSKKTVDFLFPLALQLCHEKAPQRA